MIPDFYLQTCPGHSSRSLAIDFWRSAADSRRTQRAPAVVFDNGARVAALFALRTCPFRPAALILAEATDRL